MIGYPTHLLKSVDNHNADDSARYQYLEGSIEGVDWLTNYQMSVVTFNILIYEIIGAIPPLNG